MNHSSIHVFILILCIYIEHAHPQYESAVCLDDKYKNDNNEEDVDNKMYLYNPTPTTPSGLPTKSWEA